MRTFGRGLTMAVIGPLFLVTLTAQDVVLPPDQDELETIAVRRQAPPPAASRPSRANETPFVIGPVAFRPHLSWRYLYAEGLASRDGRRVNSVLTSFSPGLLVDLGEKWTLDYTPSWRNYTARAMDDSVDQSLRLRGTVRREDWDFDFTESYQASNPTLVETARQTKQRVWVSEASAARNFGAGWSLRTTAALHERYTEQSPDTRDWSAANWVHWRMATSLTVGAGVTLGYQEIIAKPDSTYESYLLQVNWQPDDHWTISLQGGRQDRSSRSAAIPDQRNPIYSVAVSYQPFSTTTLSLSGSRTVANSYFGVALAETTNWSVALEQRLLGHFFLRANYSQGETDYTAEPDSFVAGRADERDSFDARLSVQVLRRCTFALVYSDGRNRSNIAAFDFDTKQYGVELGLRY